MLKEHFDVRPKRAAPFSLRLTVEERAELEKLADGRPLGEYVKDVIFNERRKPKRTSGQQVTNKQLFLKLLHVLGKSRLSQNINQLAKAANSGSLPVTPETEKALEQACRDIRWLRETCLESLGTKPSKATKWQGLER